MKRKLITKVARSRKTFLVSYDFLKKLLYKAIARNMQLCKYPISNLSSVYPSSWLRSIHARRGLIFSQKRGKRGEKGGKRGGKEEREIEKEGVKDGGKRKKRGKRMAGSINRLNVHTSKVRLFPGSAPVLIHHGPPQPPPPPPPPPPITHNVPIILMSTIQMINYPKCLLAFS